MMPLLLTRFGLLVLVLSLILGLGYSQQRTIKQLRAQRDQAQQHEAEKNALIQALQQQEREHEAAQLALHKTLSQIRQTHAQRETTLRSMYETPTVRSWANTPLPESLIRLREHGPFTHARAYTQHLRGGASVPTPREPPQDQWRTQPRSRSR